MVLTNRYGNSLKVVRNTGSVWWRGLRSILLIPGPGGTGWFEENFRKVIRDRRDTMFWTVMLIDGDTLFNKLGDFMIYHWIGGSLLKTWL